MTRCILIKRIVAGLFFCLAVMGCTRPPEPERINITQALSATDQADCFETAVKDTPLVFPEDFGPHDRFQTEWWYYTGNVFTEAGRHFGYQLTFFRQALSCEPVEKGSQWRTQNLYFAHFAVTDTGSAQFHAATRMNRESLSIAGARSAPYKVWIDDWQVHQQGDTQVMQATDKDFSIRFDLTPVKPMILQGDKGYSRKGSAASNASYYYSRPRMKTDGVIAINGERHAVSGFSWFDHEWSTSALDQDVAGWDWFSAHLDDGTDLMVCRIRTEDGLPNGFGFGSISFPDGSYTILTQDQFTITDLDQWKSRKTHITYPSKWEITIPQHRITLRVTPVIPDQEHDHLFAYWEGAARFEGDGRQGFGYVEMTGY